MSRKSLSAKKAKRTIADVAAELLDQIGQDHITRGWLDELHEIWDRAAAEGIVSDNEWIHPLTIHQRVIAALGRTKRGRESSSSQASAGTRAPSADRSGTTTGRKSPRRQGRTDAGGESWKPCTR